MSDESIERIEKNIEKVKTALDLVVKSDRKEKIVAMLEDEHFGELFFTAPASSKEHYHYSFMGGLVEHSFNVYKNLRALNKTFGYGFSEESMFIVSIFHDVAKACSSDVKSPHYVPVDDDWKLQKGWNYEYNTDGIYMTNHLRSLFVLQYFGVELSPEEYQSIYLNDGMYLSENRSYGLKECPLALALHIADRTALDMEKKTK